eukprot:6106483-Pleurochrysis_carterae.AAC.1
MDNCQIDAVLATSLSVALDRQAPFGGERRGSSVPLVFSSKVMTRGKSRIRARSIPFSPVQSGLERRRGED